MYKEITTVEEAFKRYSGEIDLNKATEALSFLPKKLFSGMLALLQLQVICSVVNNDVPEVPEWLPDYNNDKQWKWAPWYRGGAPGSGSGFRFFDSANGWTRTDAVGGARLALKDEERADHMDKYFSHLYKDLWLILE